MLGLLGLSRACAERAFVGKLIENWLLFVSGGLRGGEYYVDTPVRNDGTGEEEEYRRHTTVCSRPRPERSRSIRTVGYVCLRTRLSNKLLGNDRGVSERQHGSYGTARIIWFLRAARCNSPLQVVVMVEVAESGARRENRMCGESL